MADSTGTDGVKLEWVKDPKYTYIYDLYLNGRKVPDIWATINPDNDHIKLCGRKLGKGFGPYKDAEEAASVAVILARMEGVL
jgi:hypothetical protein